MRILHLSWEYPPEVYGGLGRHVRALAEEQAALGHDVAVLTQWVKGAAREESVGGVRVLRVPLDAPGVPDWRTDFIPWCFGFNTAVARAGIELSRQWRPDVLHGHDWLVAQAAVIVRTATGVPYVTTVHATESGRMGGSIVSEQSTAIDATENWMVGLADGVIVCSDFMREEVASLFGRPRSAIAVIPNGIDADAWTTTPARRRAARSAYGSPLIAFCGRLEVEKGVQTLIDALPAVRRRIPGVRAVIVGTGGAEAALTSQVRRRRLQDAVAFAGYVTDARMRAIVAAADVSAIPSLYEPFGFVALETMALGTPVVASRTGGLAEIVEDGRTGWLVDPGDSGALGRTLAEVLDDPAEARRRAAAAGAEVRTRFSWRAIAERTAAVYGSVAGASGTGT